MITSKNVKQNSVKKCDSEHGLKILFNHKSQDVQIKFTLFKLGDKVI